MRPEMRPLIPIPSALNEIWAVSAESPHWRERTVKFESISCDMVVAESVAVAESVVEVVSVADGGVEAGLAVSVSVSVRDAASVSLAEGLFWLPGPASSPFGEIHPAAKPLITAAAVVLRSVRRWIIVRCTEGI